MLVFTYIREVDFQLLDSFFPQVVSTFPLIWLGTWEASVSCRLAYTLNFNNSPFIMSESGNYETTFNNFLLHFLRYFCNFCPNTCSQEAKLMKWLHLGVVTLHFVWYYISWPIYMANVNQWKKKLILQPLL
jgi:hypothetical protein